MFYLSTLIKYISIRKSIEYNVDITTSYNACYDKAVDFMCEYKNGKVNINRKNIEELITNYISKNVCFKQSEEFVETSYSIDTDIEFYQEILITSINEIEPRHGNILYDYIELNKTLDDLSKEYKLSVERIRQLLNKAYSKVRNRIIMKMLYYDRLSMENETSDSITCNFRIRKKYFQAYINLLDQQCREVHYNGNKRKSNGNYIK